ncbi:thermonuclease family protein [Pigmentibacter sp. JX0631]|uniref:thermonuclease family protein n=1 Tax=Pigmentibacter sp. JX0631 TaxID=2976982 RepID=UPI002469BACB|nr:thermonuclease family protein [Pigmentibacter sp. JX0631]WGL60721.1 thermonuclease family protein [Pigmentibacter sp. JX0631]
MSIFKYSIPLLLSLGLQNTSFAEKEINYSVLNCHDGDTCQLKSPDNLKLKIRLIGIDAPEVANRKNKNSQPMGEESKIFINQLIKGKTVTLKNYATDPFGRALAEIYFSKENVNIKMVESGMAEVYHGKMVKEFDVSPYLTAEKTAKDKKIGIWSLKNYQSPKEFRSTKK